MTAVDAEACVRAWVNGPAGLTGAGRPLPLGAHLTRLRSPARGAYVLLSRVGGTSALTAERPVDQARVSASIYGRTKESAAAAAVAYANALEPLTLGVPAVMGAAKCVAVDDVAGPLAVDEHDTGREQFRYLVDASFFLIPA